MALLSPLPMKLEQARRHLARVNNLFTDIESSPESSSRLERDLLLEYVRRLYESLSEDVTKAAPVQEHRATRSARKVDAEPPQAGSQQESGAQGELRAQGERLAQGTPSPAPAFTFASGPAESLLPPQPAPVTGTPPTPRPPVPEPEPKTAATPPRVIEVPPAVEADVRATEAKRSATQPHQPLRTVEVSESPFAPEPDELPADVQDLFAVSGSNDLSDRLAGAPVADLTRAMAINERLLAQNDLFGGNRSELDTALEHLNTLDDYEAAVSYLGGGAAIKYDWASEERRPTARAFAKLVRRRYS